MITQMKKRQQQTQLKQQSWFQQLITQSETATGLDVNWLQQLRSDAKRSIAASPALNRQLESWRYSRVETLFKDNFDPLYGNDFYINNLNIKDYLLGSFASYRLVFVNGRYAACLSDTSELPEGVTLGSMNQAINLSVDKSTESLQRNFSQNIQTTDNVFNTLNFVLFNDGVYLHIKDAVQLDLPIEIIYLNTNQAQAENYHGSMIQTRNVISLEAASSAVLVERFLHLNDDGQYNESRNNEAANNKKYFFTNVSEIKLADNAKLKHYRLQDESREAYHLSNLLVTQQQSSRYETTNLAFGGAWARTDYKVDFKAEKAQCDLSGLYAVGDQQLVDFHLDVLHNVPSCRSAEKFKGIIYGKGRAIFDGRILVENQAQHTDAALTNDNLLLVNNAEVSTKPQLEIYADDVKCSHGTTVGRLDKQQIFYMRSRGIAEAEARKILCQGFAVDIIDEIELTELRENIASRLLHSLNSDVSG